MITDTLTNVVYFSDLLPAKCPILNAHITDALRKRGIPFVYLTGTKDISNALPECKVVGIPALEAVRRGGALNCISWNVQS